MLPSHQINKPSKLDRARVRLERAVEKLEASLASSVPADGPSHEIEELNRQNARLVETSEAVKNRLDKTIERLRLVAGEKA